MIRFEQQIKPLNRKVPAVQNVDTKVRPLFSCGSFIDKITLLQHSRHNWPGTICQHLKQIKDQPALGNIYLNAEYNLAEHFDSM